MSALDCSRMRDLAPELALGALSGEDRGRALAHLAGCDACRRLVADLTLTADDLLLAGPATEPPPGFDSRVLRRIHRRHHPGLLVAAAAGVALVVALLVGVLVQGNRGPTRQDLRSARGIVIGTAVVYGGQPARLVVDVHDAGYDGACLVRVTPRGGRTITLRGLRLQHGAGSLSTPYDGRAPARVVVEDVDGGPLASTDATVFGH